jgi:hypothetical protein
MNRKVDNELIRIFEFEINCVKANRHMEKDHKAAKIKKLEQLIQEEREKQYA